MDADGNITGWLNELAFVPVDANPDAMARRVERRHRLRRASTSPRTAVIKLAPRPGIDLPEELSPAEKLKFVQNLQAQGDPRTRGIYETLGVYFGYEIAYYAMFYDIKHVLIMGRVTSGTGGVLLLDKAKRKVRDRVPRAGQKDRAQHPGREQPPRGSVRGRQASLPAITAG